ncbi:hypothetical protein Ancab_017385 [Ancistrocladus abbreviatus]
MENGAGFVDQDRVEQVKAVKDEFSEPKTEETVVSGHHGLEDSEGDEFFEEAIEGNFDGVRHTKKPDSEDVAASASANDEMVGDSDSSELDGNLSAGHEVMEDAVEVPAQVESHEQEGLKKGEESLDAESDNVVSLANVNDKGGTVNGVVFVNAEGDTNYDVNRNAIVEDVNVELKEVGKSELVAYGDDAKERESEHVAVRERETSEGSELVGEKSRLVSAAVEKSANGDSNKMEKDGTDGCETRESNRPSLHEEEVVQDLEDANAILCDNHVDEISRKLGNASADISSEDQTDKSGESEEPLTADAKKSGSVEKEGALLSFTLDNQDVNVVISEDASVSNSSKPQNGENGKSGNNPSAFLPHQQEGGLKLTAGASVENTKVGSRELLLDCKPPAQDSTIKNRDESEIVKYDSGRESNSTDQPQPTGEDVDDTRDYHVVKEQLMERETLNEGKQNGQASREMEKKPAASSNSSSGRSANPVLLTARPAGLGRAAPLLEPAPRVVQQPRSNGTVSQVQAQHVEEATNGEANEGDETREKLQMIRVKFLRLAHRLGQTPHNVVVAQVLYRLGLAEQLRGRPGGRSSAFSFDRASAMAEQLEATGQEPLDFSCTIMVLGKTGVGKSATINSIFDEVKFGTDAFQLGTKKVQDIVGTVQGIKVRVIDTPGLLPSWSDQRQNEKILHSVKRFITKTPPDIVLYLDRLDMQSRDFGDMPLLRTITGIFGPSIWFNAIVVLTHAASAPPEGPNGTASTYDMFVTQRSHAVQQAIRQAAGDMRLMNPVSLVENHLACRINRAGQRVLPNGQVWKPHLLLLSFASKILAEANTLLKLQDTPPGRPFTARSKSPPLPFLLSSLLQSRPQLKLPEEQFGDDDALDDDLDESSDSDDESEYDELPPFRHLSKAQLAKLTKSQRKAYYDELEYREKLFMKKQLKEEKKRRKMMKKLADSVQELPGEYGENVEEESAGAASVPVPMLDLALPASFDSDNPTHRYRYLDNSNQWLVRPVLDTHGWDHDVGYEGINVERLFVVKDKIPLSFSGQFSKDKKEANLQMEAAGSIKHGEGKATTLGFDMQSVGKDMAYTLRSETRFSNYRHNKATAGLSVTLLGDAWSAGMKVEDKLIANKQFRLVASGGVMTGRGDVAYGGSLEATLRDKNHPLGRSLSSLGLSVMDWHGDLALGCNIQSQIPVGRFTNLIARVNLNNRGSGQVSIRLNSSEQLQLALFALVPLVRKLISQPQQYPFGH